MDLEYDIREAKRLSG